jgi:hypothetical protein
MAKISASEMKWIIAQIKRRSPSPVDLAQRGLVNRTWPSASGRFEEVRSTLERAGLDVKKLVEKAGLDIHKLKEIEKREQRERGHIRKKQTAAAQKALAATKNPFRHGIDERLKTLSRLAAVRPGQVDHVILDTPFLIWAHPDNMLESSVIQPSKSIAGFSFMVSTPPTDPGQDFKHSDNDVSFWFIWQNNYGQEVMINAEASFIAKGIIFIFTEFHPYSILSAAGGSVLTTVRLDIWEMWNSPETSPLQEQDQFISFEPSIFVVASLGIPIGSDQLIVNVSQAFNPRHNGFFLVPRNGSLLFQVSVAFSTFLKSADEFDPLDVPPPSATASVGFSRSVDNFVECPFVHLEVIAPPIVT